MSCCLSAVGSAQGSTSTAGLDTWPNASVSSRPCLMQNVAIICHHIIISNIFDDQRQLRLIFAISWTLDQTLSPYESNIHKFVSGSRSFLVFFFSVFPVSDHHGVSQGVSHGVSRSSAGPRSDAFRPFPSSTAATPTTPGQARRYAATRRYGDATPTETVQENRDQTVFQTG